jgi:hypothetical protein
MTYPRNAQPVGAGSGGADAEKAAFLRDLRALRDHAGLGARDLAARAHFPEDTLKTAEAGPALPSLPVLQAYVRGCGAGETEWEDRWRRLNVDSASGSGALPTRASATARPTARVMPFPEQDGGPSTEEQDAIGFGLARVARGLAPIDPDPGLGGPSGGWFDPAPRAPSPDATSAGSMFTPPTPGPSSPEASPGAPTVQYPALSGYQHPETSYPGSYQSPGYEPPAYEPPEMFRTPAPEPPSPPAPAAPGSGSTMAGLGTQAPGPAGPPVPPESAELGFGSAGTGLGSLGRRFDSTGTRAGTGPGPAGSPVTAGTPAPAAHPGSPAPSATSGPAVTSGSRAASGPSATSGPLSASASPAASGPAKAHAAPASSRRRAATGAIAAVIAVLVIAVVVALILFH